MEKLNNGLTKISVGEIVGLCFDKLDLIDAFVIECKQNGKKASNAPNDRTRINFILDRLVNVPENVTFELEGCRGDNGSFFPNAGSLIECVVKYFMNKGKVNNIAKSQMYEYDAMQGCVAWEIKTCTSPKNLATPSKAETTLLVNGDGVHLIKKSEVLGYTNKQGRLPFHCNTMTAYQPKWLNEALGFNGGVAVGESL